MTFASSPPTGTSGSAGFGMRRSRSSSCCSVAASSASIASIRSPRGGAPGAQLRDLGAVGRGAAADRLADLLAGGVALGLELVRLGLQPAALGVDLDRPVDQRRVLALVDGALADALGLVAEALDADAHAEPSPAAPASVRRRMTKSRSRLASSQPARGPLGRPRNARYRALNAAFASTPCSCGDGEDRGLPLLAARQGLAVGDLGERAQEAALLGAEQLHLDRQRVALDLDEGALRRVRLEPAADGGEADLELGRLVRRSAALPFSVSTRAWTSMPGIWTSSARWRERGPERGAAEAATSASGSSSE